MSDQVFRFENPFRTIHETYAVTAWAAAALVAVAGIYTTQFPADFFVLFALMCCAFGSLRYFRARQLYVRQQALIGTPVSFIKRADLRAKVKARAERGEGPAIFLGYGFTWGQEKAQLAHTVSRLDPTRIVPPIDERMGQPWIHGIGILEEREIWLPIEHTAGHVFLCGTTRSGKTRMLDLIVSQAVDRGECVAIWDPKQDIGLMMAAKNACIDSGRERDFVYFSPAFPEKSFRIDPLANFSRATELATRVASLIQTEGGGGDVFSSHAQMVLTNICEGLLMISTKPTLKLLKRYVDSGPEGLVVKASTAYFTKHVPDWEGQAEAYVSRAKGRSDRELAIAYITYYREVVQRQVPSNALEGLYADFEHEKTHQSKMLASLTPVLTMLTAGTLGDLLSPDPDVNDPRPITDFATIIRNQQVCYIGLDSLSDSMVGNAIGSMFLADMTAVSGARYNYAKQDDLKPVNLIVDEAAELAGDKLIQLLNKSGGANFRCILASQTMADFSARVGSEAKARQVLGNLNHTIALRLRDGETSEYIAESLPETFVRHIEYTQATSTDTKDLIGFGYRVTEAMKETAVPLAPAQIFSLLPNLEFFALIGAGRLEKCRIPILKD